MAEVLRNSNINMADFTAKCMEVEGYHSAGPELDALLKTAGEDVIWKTFEKFEHDEMTGNDGGNQNMNNSGFGGGGAPNVRARNVDGFGGFGAPAVGANEKKFTRPQNDVTEVAKFAVLEHDRQDAWTNLVFVRLVRSTKWRAGDATYYALLIATRDSNTLAPHLSKALVNKNRNGKALLSWVDIN